MLALCAAFGLATCGIRRILSLTSASAHGKSQQESKNGNTYLFYNAEVLGFGQEVLRIRAQLARLALSTANLERVLFLDDRRSALRHERQARGKLREFDQARERLTAPVLVRGLALGINLCVQLQLLFVTGENLVQFFVIDNFVFLNLVLVLVLLKKLLEQRFTFIVARLLIKLASLNDLQKQVSVDAIK